MTQLTNDVFAVEVPEGVEGCEIRGEHPGRPYQLLSFYGEAEAIALPPGNWQVICTTKEATEEQAKGIVEHDTFIGGYKDYDTERFHHEDPFIKATDSLNSLLVSKGLEIKNNYVLLKKG